MIDIRINGHRIFLLPVIKGLVSEAEVVKDAFQCAHPSRVFISISPEQLQMLGEKDTYHEYDPSMIEAAYAFFLNKFGAVEIPPPCYVQAYDLCQQQGIEVSALDMDEERFTELYCDNIGTMEMFRESRFAKKAPKKKFNLRSPQAFVKDWDAKVNSTRGFRSLEKAREEYMANLLQEECKSDGILVLIELERFDGILKLLNQNSTPLRADIPRS